MEKVNFNYSMKNIPIPPKQDYQIQFIKSVETFVKNIRWRSFFFLNPNDTPNRRETFGFNTTSPAPHVDELKELENELFELTKNIKFKDVKDNNFQNDLKADVKNVEKVKELILAADKTNNFYKVKKEDHDVLLQKHITKDYKKAQEGAFENNTKADKRIATKLELQDRIYKTSKKQAFITLKDHKPSFNNNPTCRLLNPTKPELGKVSKHILANIVKVVNEKTKSNLWRNTQSVISWFKEIDMKKRSTFIQFDVIEFYPSITAELLVKALNFASGFVDISDEDRDIIFQARKSFLLDSNIPWVKKTNANFDVGMGCYDGAECCELVGLYLLSLLKHLKVILGLYRDDGLGVSHLTPRQTELVKQDIIDIFKKEKLSIEIVVNHNVVNFLDVTFDLNSGIYKPYSKPNNFTQYINKNSNHPLQL